ncbi:NAD-dependent epimerase/dehydratase family protein [Adhaeribacter swui]|uniref:NAD-dependent epimerase/dehydratase family protein n=1 Tax=Adhaeribacter swui TaxID=2086471 RepID=A0A7G7G5G7_9BACT|nr:NAD-dependent epimerase/dehydratase family protein [Adhaeribacter swui]QNF32401.1 NAD-dependent epimerase/dehydratase family protein [Adhaeribacter swui]
MNVLLTGSSGFLGKVLQSSLSNQNYNVITLGRASSNNIKADLQTGVPVINTSVDIVVHAAGKAHVVPRTEAESKEFFQVNFEGTKNLCQALLQLDKPVKSFIFISTVAVYGLEEGQLIPEKQPLKGETPYAKSKILAEAWLKKWAKENNITLGILRLPLIAGPNPPGNLGAMIKGIHTGRYLGVGKSDARKSVVWAEDVATIIPKVAEVGGTYNLTDGYHPSFKELEDGIAAATGKKQPRHIPVPVAKSIALFGNLLGSKSPITTSKLHKMMSTLTFDDSRAKEKLDWHPTSVLQNLPMIV